jgi:F420-non-reducing hydrogenase iron-sulfur subunit
LNSKILVFSCNWDGWSCVEAAANSGLKYPAAVKVVRVSCLSRVHSGLILKAFELRADGVMLLGCEPGSCPFDSDSECINAEYEKSLNILELLGISKDRMALVHLPAFAGQEFITRITEFAAEIESVPAARRVRTPRPKN